MLSSVGCDVPFEKPALPRSGTITVAISSSRSTSQTLSGYTLSVQQTRVTDQGVELAAFLLGYKGQDTIRYQAQLRDAVGNNYALIGGWSSNVVEEVDNLSLQFAGKIAARQPLTLELTVLATPDGQRVDSSQRHQIKPVVVEDLASGNLKQVASRFEVSVPEFSSEPMSDIWPNQSVVDGDVRGTLLRVLIADDVRMYVSYKEINPMTSTATSSLPLMHTFIYPQQLTKEVLQVGSWDSRKSDVLQSGESIGSMGTNIRVTTYHTSLRGRSGSWTYKVSNIEATDWNTDGVGSVPVQTRSLSSNLTFRFEVR